MSAALEHQPLDCAYKRAFGWLSSLGLPQPTIKHVEQSLICKFNTSMIDVLTSFNKFETVRPWPLATG